MIYLYQYRIPSGGKVESLPYLRRAVSAYLAEIAGNPHSILKLDGDSKPDDFNAAWEIGTKHTITGKKTGEKQNLLLSVQIEKTKKGKPEVRLTMGDGPTGLPEHSGLTDRQEHFGLIDLPEHSGLTDGSERFHLSGFYVSATHTKNLVICAVGRENIGIDGEFPEERRAETFYEKIAARFFTDQERRYVEQTGSKGFFEIWVRKEAYMKYTGEGMAYGFRNIETRGSAGFLEEIDGCRILFERRGGLYFACAGGRTELIWK